MIGKRVPRLEGPRLGEESIDCCHDRSHIVRPTMADFLATYL